MSKKKRTKNILLVIVVGVILFVVLNIGTYVISGKNVIEYFRADKKTELNGIWNELKGGRGQSVTIDNYTIALEGYLFEDKTNDGYVCFSVKRKGYDMREETAGEIKIFGQDGIFGENNRFMIDVVGSSMSDTIFIKEKDIMYIYYKFDVDNYEEFSNEILLCDSKTGGKDWRYRDNAIYIYELEDNIDDLSELESKYAKE